MLIAIGLLALASPQQQACGYDRAGHGIAMGETTADAQMSAKPAWFSTGEVRLGPKTYVKFGTPQQMAAFELAAFKAVDEKGGVPVFMAFADGEPDLSVAYVLVSSAECSFQRFGEKS